MGIVYAHLTCITHLWLHRSAMNAMYMMLARCEKQQKSRWLLRVEHAHFPLQRTWNKWSHPYLAVRAVRMKHWSKNASWPWLWFHGMDEFDIHSIIDVAKLILPKFGYNRISSRHNYENGGDLTIVFLLISFNVSSSVNQDICCLVSSCWFQGSEVVFPVTHISSIFSCTSLWACCCPPYRLILSIWHSSFISWCSLFAEAVYSSENNTPCAKHKL